MNFLIALLLGAASAFAFEPYALWPLMPLAFAGLCELIARAPTLRRALLVGWGFAVGQFCVGLNWIATAFTYQAAMPAWLGWVAVVLLSFYLAVYPMLAAGLAWRFGRDRPSALVLALAGAWAITEWLRATMFTGFAWNPVGVTLIDTWARPLAPLIGTYGLSALLVLGSGLAVLFVRHLIREIRSKPLTWKRGLTIVAVVVLPELLALALLPWLLSGTRPQSDDRGSPIRIVQPNIGQADKWRDGFDEIAATRLAALSTRAYPEGAVPDTIYWPEAAITAPLLDERDAGAADAAAERRRAVRSIRPGQLLATGGIALTAQDRAQVDGATNSVFVLDSAGTIVGRYDKAHLVPYGEYLPMRPILSAIGLSRLAPGELDFQPGPGARTLALPNGRKMGVQLCYEIIFSGEVVDPQARPDYLFNPSNDAWFGAWGPPQHLAQARLRAAEEALPVIRATPTGISAMIDATGALVATVGSARPGIIDVGLPKSGRPTPFARLGNLIPLALGFLMLGIAIALGRSRRYSAHI